jgi:hypothetical protein|tara:strand:+ start:381 stop:563 length:183 start_codon:yes stop_codon:yes gene_type:complete
MAASNRTVAFTEVLYAVPATGDRWFVPTTGYGDNADSGTKAQQLTQCELLSPQGVEVIGE